MRVSAGATISSEPDLSLVFPGGSTQAVGPPAWFVDTQEKRGRTLARFDAVIFNSAGVLDLYTPDGGATVYQVVWSGGRPPADDLPSATEPPRTLGVQTDITPAGAVMKFVGRRGHNHFHFQRAARYELVLAGGVVRSSAKVGFCMLDSWQNDAENYFGIGVGHNFCQHGNPGAPFARMGISPGVGDYYSAQLADQWVDVTGVRPGKVRLRGTVNPSGVLIESDTSNNTVEATRIVPGAIAHAPAKPVRAHGPVVFAVRGGVVGANVPTRKSAACELFTSECYETADPHRLEFKIRMKPRHGTAQILTERGRLARIRYTPERRYHGTDTITFTVADSRGLKSRPAIVRLRVG